jgi:type II secretory pathway component PulF
LNSFAYTAVEPSGRKRSGVVEAADKDSAVAQVSSTGLFVVDIRADEQTKKETSPHRHKRPSRSDVAIFTRRMADLSAAGLPLDRVLSVVAEQSESEALTQIALAALEEVRAGSAVSAALAKNPKVFNEVYTQTLRAGEASGQFPEVATRLADFQETEVARRSQISAALIYPAILSFTAVFVVIFLLVFVVPRLSGVFKDLGNDLPLSTKMLLGLASFITTNWMAILAAIAALVVGYRVWSRSEAGMLARDRIILQLPVIGKVWMKAVVSRFSHVLGTLLYGGVPVLEALSIAGKSAGNSVFRKSSDLVADDVREGRSIAGSMKDAGTFPPVLTNMVAVGEETGDLPKMLGRVAKSLDFEVDNGMRRLTALVEPFIVLFMGIVVGFVVLSVILPIYQAQDLVK